MSYMIQTFEQFCDPSSRHGVMKPLQVDLMEERVGGGQGTRKRQQLMRRLVKAGTLFDATYVIACSSCGTSALEFESESQAKEVLKQSIGGTKCKVCEDGKLRAEEFYKANPSIVRGLRQGLWLENLVCDAFKPFAAFVVTGRMIESFELDVVVIIANKVILLECKDTSFGQNDYINLSVKADEIDADIIGVVTTNPVHENVKALIERRREEENRSIFVIEDVENPDQIRTELESQMDSIRRDYVQNLLHRGDSLHYRTFTTGRRNRRLPRRRTS